MKKSYFRAAQFACVIGAALVLIACISSCSRHSADENPDSAQQSTAPAEVTVAPIVAPLPPAPQVSTLPAQPVPAIAPPVTTVAPSAVVVPVQSIALADIKLSPDSVGAGDKFSITVDLTAPAPAGGVLVALTMDSTNEDPIVVPQGSKIGTQSWTAGGNSSSSTFYATYSGKTCQAILTIVPALSGITISPGTIRPGDTFSVRVDLTSPAPAGGVSVDLTQDGLPQLPIVVEEGNTWQSVAHKAGTESMTYEASYNGQSAHEIAKVFIPNCSDLDGYNTPDDTPCYSNGGNLITYRNF